MPNTTAQHQGTVAPLAQDKAPATDSTHASSALAKKPTVTSSTPLHWNRSQIGEVAYQHVTLVGDSVLLGASPYLMRRLPFASVEAKVGRQGSEGIKIVQSLRDEAQLGDAAVIHLGTNGYLTEKHFRALLDMLADRKKVVVVNVHGARRWIQPNNELIARVTKNFDNVRLVDWDAIGQANPNYFVQDGIHLSGIGIHAYYSQIRMALGQPEAMVTGPKQNTARRPQLSKPSAVASPLPELSTAPLTLPMPETPAAMDGKITSNPGPASAAD
jgi:hypothetical protein